MQDGAVLHARASPGHATQSPGNATQSQRPKGSSEPATPVLPANSVRRNAAWLLIGNIATAAAQCGITIVLSKLGSEAIQGRFSLCMNIAAPLSILLALNLRALILTDVTEQFAFHEYMAVRLISCVAMVPVCVAIGLAIWLAGKFDGAFVLVLAVVGAFKAVEWVSEMCQSAFQKRQRMEFAAISQTLRATLVLVAAGIVMFATRSLLAVCIAWLAVSVAVLMSYDFTHVRRFDTPWGRTNARRLRAIVRQAIPLVVTIVLLSLNTNLSSYIIAGHCSLEEVGYFTAMNYVVQALALAFVAVGTAAIPRMAEHFQSDPARLWPLLTKGAMLVGAIAVAAFVGSLLWGRWFLTVAYRASYAEHVHVLWILTGGSLLIGLASLAGFAATACRVFRASAAVWAVVVVVTLVGGLVLVPRWRISGAAWANVISSAAALTGMLGLVAWAVRRRMRELSAVPAIGQSELERRHE